jgi:phosphatidylethanolamine/phosphatidyl-N-methylethanolamine N-methyltransferase
MNDQTIASNRGKAAARAAGSRFGKSPFGKSGFIKSRFDKPRLRFDNDQIEKTYARWAPFYDPAFARIMRWGRLAAVAAANRHIGGRVLDVGVGTGLELPMFDPSLKVVGIDLCEPMLRRAARRAHEADLQQLVGLTQMDACRLAFADASFDVVIAPFVLTVLPQPEASLDEWVRVLRPDGEIVLVNHISAEQGPLARLESWLGRYGASLGWRPEFPWSVLGNWLAGRPDLELIERRPLSPFGLFTLTRIKKTRG